MLERYDRTQAIDSSRCNHMDHWQCDRVLVPNLAQLVAGRIINGLSVGIKWVPSLSK